MGGKTRKRRSAEEARELILDAAEAQLRERGPDALRLKALAAEIGVSHPAILHHFGSRAGLVQSVMARTTGRIKEQIERSLAGEIDEDAGASLLDQIFRVLGDPGNARIFAWLALTRGPDADLPIGAGSQLREIAQVVHRRRVERHPEREDHFEDTLFTVLLAGLALFGNALSGRALLTSAGLGDDAGADHRFVVWLARRLHEHLDTPG